MDLSGTVLVNGKACKIVKLIGHGKGGYSYLADMDGRPAVLKQIHHEPCSYYNFGNKIEAEFHDYERLKHAGIRIPEMLAIDFEQERILKEYIEGTTIFEIVKSRQSAALYIGQAEQMAEQARAHGLNIDYFPTNFVVRGNVLYYVDYECNHYMEEWNFANWGIKYWSFTPEFEKYLQDNGLV